MKIKEVNLTNFKRFTNLTLAEIPASAKLVLLIGANGSGKSCVFDAFDCVMYQNMQHNPALQRAYYGKNTGDFQIKISTHQDGTCGYPNWELEKNTQHKFIGRSSIRIIPRLGVEAKLEQIENDLDHPNSYVDFDTRFINDVALYIKNLNDAVIFPMFEGLQVDTKEVFLKNIAPLNDALLRIFKGNKKNTIQISAYQDKGVTTPQNLFFKKGTSTISYELLSHGEKQVLILLLNFMVRRSYYENAVIFIDEMDCHLNTALQYSLLEEIVTNWIPDSAQLWTASHALGFISYAQKSSQGVVFDLDMLDFDVPQVLVPEPKNTPHVYDIAVGEPFLEQIFKDKNVYFVENTDKELYATLGLPNSVFVATLNKDAVYYKTKSSTFMGIVDRDLLSDSDVALIRKTYPNLYVLEYYCIENYLYHPENLVAYFAEKGLTFDKEDYIKRLIAEKEKMTHDMLLRMATIRVNYKYFDEPDNENVARFRGKDENFKECDTLATYLMSEEVDTFFKVFSMKAHARTVPQRQNMDKYRLAETTWFREKMTNLLNG